MNQMPTQPSYDYDEIDLREIFKTIGKWKYKIVGFTLVCTLLSGLASWFLIEPVYEATTIIAINQEKITRQSIGPIEDMVDQLGDMPAMTPQSSLEQIKAPGIMQSTIDRLKLGCSRNRLASMIRTEQIKDTNLIKIIVGNPDPELATRIANTVREEFVVHLNQVNAQKLGRSLDAMENRWLKQEERDLRIANDNLKNYKLRSRSMEFLTTQLTQRNNDLAACQSNLVLAEIRKDKLIQGIRQEQENLKNTPPTVPVVSNADSEQPVTLGGINISSLKISSQEINDAYVMSNDSLNKKKTELAETEAEISKTGNEVQELDQEIKTLEAEMINNQIEEKKLSDEVERRENVIKLLNSKISEVKMSEAMDMAGNSVITVSKAVVPEAPVKPNKTLNVAIAAVLGLMLSVFGVFLNEYLRNEQ